MKKTIALILILASGLVNADYLNLIDNSGYGAANYAYCSPPNCYLEFEYIKERTLSISEIDDIGFYVFDADNAILDGKIGLIYEKYTHYYVTSVPIYETEEVEYPYVDNKTLDIDYGYEEISVYKGDEEVIKNYQSYKISSLSGIKNRIEDLDRDDSVIFRIYADIKPGEAMDIQPIYVDDDGIKVYSEHAWLNASNYPYAHQITRNSTNNGYSYALNDTNGVNEDSFCIIHTLLGPNNDSYLYTSGADYTGAWMVGNQSQPVQNPWSCTKNCTGTMLKEVYNATVVMHMDSGMGVNPLDCSGFGLTPECLNMGASCQWNGTGALLGDAIEFKRDNDAINSTWSDYGNGDFSIEFTFAANESDQGNCDANGVFASWSLDTALNDIRWYDVDCQINFNAGGVRAIGLTNNLDDSAYHHVVGVFDENGTSDHSYIYIDGELDGDGINNAGAFASIHPIYFGAKIDAAGSWSVPWDGTMDEITIYSRALSAEEIQEHYQSLILNNRTALLSQLTSNSDPTLTVLDLNATTLYSNDAFSCNVTGLDAENTTFLIEYLVYNGTSLYAYGNTTSAANNTNYKVYNVSQGLVYRFENWSCNASIYDGTKWSHSHSYNVTSINISNSDHNQSITTIDGLSNNSDVSNNTNQTIIYNITDLDGFRNLITCELIINNSRYGVNLTRNGTGGNLTSNSTLSPGGYWYYVNCTDGAYTSISPGWFMSVTETTTTINLPAELYFQDNTHTHKLLCCNAAQCFEIPDMSIIYNNTEMEFNRVRITGVESCYEVRNTGDIDYKDWIIGNFIALAGMAIIFFLVLMFSVRWARG